MMIAPFIAELRTGKVKRLGREGAENPMERTWETGMFKEIREGKVWLSKTGLEADEVADMKNHGGEEKAIFAYPMHHYDYWREKIPHADISVGGMGENLVIADVDEFTVCIGDIFQFGEAIVQVSQPRQPCWKPARRYEVLDLALQIQHSGKTGWYFRVLEEGYVQTGETLQLMERPHEGWSIATCNEVMHEKKYDLIATRKLMLVEALAPNWKRTLQKRLRGAESSIRKRVYGENIE